MSRSWRNPVLYAAWLANRRRKFTIEFVAGWQLIEPASDPVIHDADKRLSQPRIIAQGGQAVCALAHNLND